ncbi:MAG: histidine--tRNA ligase [Treponema sp.]|jgi:histidyl-tRNA synthetase|nr:histidine--tRNA ligase [Treponema sp.]
MIEPKVLKGFRDFLPPQESARRSLIAVIEASFRSFGFVPIDTPALEYADILLGKGGGETEKQVYRFTDHGGREVALRFDLTVPFARFVAEHRSELTLPFKRYHIAKVWRGENTQRGRYREFTQCDFDIVGSNSAAADFEILLIMRNTFASLGADALIRINHRGLFNRFLTGLGAGEKSVEVLRCVDKLAKQGLEQTALRLGEITGEKTAERILEYIGVPAQVSICGSRDSTNGGPDSMNENQNSTSGSRSSFGEVLERLSGAAGTGPETERLSLIHRYMKDTGTEASFVLDPSITRGLDYYTGVVFETFLRKLPGIGSVCSGGRYDDLAGLYSKEQLCGVGSSIGLDRLQAALEELGQAPRQGGCARAAIVCRDEAEAGLNQVLAEQFRRRGISCEVFPEPKKFSAQFVLAEKKGIPWAIIPEGEKITLRNIAARENRENLSLEEAAALLKE